MKFGKKELAIGFSALLSLVLIIHGYRSLSFDETDGPEASDALNEVRYLWSGGLQTTGCTVVAKMTRPSSSCFLIASTNRDLSDSIVAGPFRADMKNNLMVKMRISGLVSGTQYYFAVASEGEIDRSVDDIGSFSTPPDGPFSFRFSVGSCSHTGDHPVFGAILRQAPLFHITTGDFHYGNPNSASRIDEHRRPYETEILAPRRSATLFRNVPLAYVWDDHDYCGDNSDASSAGRSNAIRAYQEYIPHYPLAAGSGDVAIYQSFTIGRVRFILTDLRSERTDDRIMSKEQEAWFRNECIEARDNKLLIAWVSSVSLGGSRQDNWGGFRKERAGLSNFFRDEGIRNMFILGGDAHMIAIDDGSNHDFTRGRRNPHRYPVFQAAALNRRGSVKGGRYSEGGPFPNPDNQTGQYGMVEVEDHGGPDIEIVFKGFRLDSTGKESELVTYRFKRTLNAGELEP